MSRVNSIAGILPRTVFVVRDTNSQPVNADAVPTIDNANDVHVNGVLNAGLGFGVTQLQDSTPANIVGYYEVLAGAGSLTLTVGDVISVVVRTAVGAVNISDEVEFMILPSATQNVPSVDFG